MTADTSQVIVLQAKAAPVAIPFDRERGRGVVEENNACLVDKVAHQDQNPATAPQHQHQQQQQQQQQHNQSFDSHNRGKDDEQRRTVISGSTNTNASADVAAVQRQDPQQQKQKQQQQQQQPPKWVRIGEKVCFSTVVAAVLIPSSHDLTPSTKRELWWQPADYAEFRVNYATHMHNPSFELEEEEREASGADPAPAVPVAANADAPAATATVEGVLVVAASPAPAPLTSRPPNPDEGVSGGRSHAASAGASGGSHKVGSGAGGGAAAPSQDRLPKSKPSTRYEKSARARPVAQLQQYNNAPVRHRVGGGAGYKASPQRPHHSAYMAQHQFHGMQQQQQQAVMMMQGQHAAGFGRRDARHDPYLAPRGGGNMNNGRYQPQHHHHAGHAVGNTIGRHGPQQQQQQFFVNGNPAGAAYRSSNGPFVEAFLPRHGAGGVTGGVAMAAAVPAQAFSSRVGGGVAGVVSRSAVGVGVGHMPVPFQACNSSQFSMWRSQVVFAPIMQMQ